MPISMKYSGIERGPVDLVLAVSSRKCVLVTMKILHWLQLLARLAAHWWTELRS